MEIRNLLFYYTLLRENQRAALFSVKKLPTFLRQWAGWSILSGSSAKRPIYSSRLTIFLTASREKILLMCEYEHVIKAISFIWKQVFALFGNNRYNFLYLETNISFI